MSICCDVQHPIPSDNHARYECLRVERPTRRGDQITSSLPQDHTASFYACKSSWGILMPTHLHFPHLCGNDPPQTVRWSSLVQGVRVQQVLQFGARFTSGLVVRTYKQRIN